MTEQLWSDERIAERAAYWETIMVGHANIAAVEWIQAATTEVRDDLQAALDAANQRIHELEIEREAMLLSLTLREQALRQLEAQLEWEPLPDGDYTFGLPDSDYVQMIRLRRNGEDFTEWCENPSTGSTSDVDGISLYWSGFRLFRRVREDEQ